MVPATRVTPADVVPHPACPAMSGASCLSVHRHSPLSPETTFLLLVLRSPVRSIRTGTRHHSRMAPRPHCRPRQRSVRTALPRSYASSEQPRVPHSEMRLVPWWGCPPITTASSLSLVPPALTSRTRPSGPALTQSGLRVHRSASRQAVARTGRSSVALVRAQDSSSGFEGVSASGVFTLAPALMTTSRRRSVASIMYL